MVIPAEPLVSYSAQTCARGVAVSLSGSREIFGRPRQSEENVPSSRLAEAVAPTFSDTVRSLNVEIQRVLGAAPNPLEFEHRSVRFWATCSRLRPFLGQHPRQDEIIVACDVMRGQFRGEMVSVAAMQALHQVLGRITQQCPPSQETVDACYDMLEEAGMDLNFPLRFDHGITE